MLGVISFPDLDLSIPSKVRADLFDADKDDVSHITTSHTAFSVFPDVPAAAAVCGKSNIRTVWDAAPQVGA